MSLLIGDKDYEHHELAIIKNVDFGMCDNHKGPVLSFDARQPNAGSMQGLEGAEITAFLTHEYNGRRLWISSLRELEGMPLIVRRDGGFMHVVGIWRP